jgi:DNA-binding Lrp family transcriptional regulator
MNMRDEVLKVVPVGPEHRQPITTIWAMLGAWSRWTVRKRLEELAAEGLIVRTSEKIATGVRYHYHREGPA